MKQVTPLVKEAQLELLGPKERKCLYNNEAAFPETVKDYAEITQEFNSSLTFSLNKTMFTSYSQTGCFHGCKVLGTLLVDHYYTKVDCLPWNHTPVKLEGKINGSK